ncbi:hypothetical protein EYC80_002828 [Monilinia laxa]|uniref:Chromo domain-containing protein n=1 Tax=Monilinia laxa TaxID=61186 RepID=A0A5N6KD01_MONLA|nr:hypothetical protein EYC80_002828 [Monilinia laxa]
MFSGVSLWDNEEDAVKEVRRFGAGGEDVEVFTVDGDLLRRGGSVVFCMEELLERDSTHNIPRIPPVTATKNANDTLRVKNERGSVSVAQTPQRLLSPLISNHIQQDSSTVEFKTSEQQQSDKNTLQEKSDPTKKITSITTERVKERTLFDWDLNTGMDSHSHERKKNMQEMRKRHRNSTVMGMEGMEGDKSMTKGEIRELRRGNRRSISVVMEVISEDVSVDSHTIHSASSKSSTTSKKSCEEPQSQHQGRSARRIASSARITRKGTFGTGSLREDIFISSESSSPALPSQDPTMSPGQSGMNSSRNASTNTSISRDGYSSEDSLSAGSDIPAIAKPKPHNPTDKYLNSSLPSSRRPKKFQKTSGRMKAAGSWAETEPSDKGNDLILDYGRTRQPIITTISKARPEKMLEERDVLRNKASINIVPEEWPLKNEEPFNDIGTIAVQRKGKGKGTIADTMPLEKYSPLDGNEPDPISKSQKARKPEAKPESKSIVKSKNEEKAWIYKGIVAAGVRNYDGEFKQSYLVEWEGDWAPTWQQKGFIGGPMMAQWEKKCKFWKAESRTEAGRRLKREKKIERVLFDEIPKGKYLLVQYTSDLRPEWVTKSKVDDATMKEFLERKKTWRYWGGGLRNVDSKDDEDEDEEEESSPAEVETDDGEDLASDEQEWTDVQTPHEEEYLA